MDHAPAIGNRDHVSYDVPQLGPNAKTSAPCSFSVRFIGGSFEYVDVSLVVSYKPSFYPFRRSEEFRYVARRRSDGTYAWTPMAQVSAASKK